MLFLFLDGVGLGPEDVETNPFARASMPNLDEILDGKRLVRATLGANNNPWVTDRATLLGLDATLGVAGHPQSASGQTAILTGQNIPAKMGQHYGPKPNPEIIQQIENGTIFSILKQKGFESALLNAYPQGYFDTLESGRRLPGAIAMSTLAAGISLKTTTDLIEGEALSADFTAQGWRDHLKVSEAPLLTAYQAGAQLARLAHKIDFAFFEYWLSDYAGHRAKIEQACELLKTFDEMLGGLLAVWDPADGLIFITSDHGNLENLDTRRHTINLVPGLVIGDLVRRQEFTNNLHALTDIAPAILRYFKVEI